MAVEPIREESLLILKRKGASQESEGAIKQLLGKSDVAILGEKRLQGFSQCKGIDAGENLVLLVDVADLQTLKDIRCDIIMSLGIPATDIYCPDTEEEAHLSVNTLFPAPSPAELPQTGPLSTPHARKFTYDPDIITSSSSHGGTRSPSTSAESTRQTANAPPRFMARAVPTSQNKPDIEPRITKAAALRMGIAQPTKERPRGVKSPEFEDNAFKRASSTVPKSLQAPAIAPRPTRASSFRSGETTEQEIRPKPLRQTSNTSDRSNAACFVNTPGHKRQSTITVESTKTPTMAPRQNRAAMLRAGGTENVDPNSRPASVPRRQAEGTSDRGNRYEDVPGYRRRSLQISVASTAAPSIQPRMTKAAALRMGVPFSSPSVRSEPAFEGVEEDEQEMLAGPTDSNLMKTPSGRSSVASSSASDTGYKAKLPSIVPRTNKSAALRMSRQGSSQK